MGKTKRERGELFVAILIIGPLSTTAIFHGFVLSSICLLQQKWEERIKFLIAAIDWLDAMPTAYAPVIECEQMGYS